MFARFTAYCLSFLVCGSVAAAQRPVSSRQIREADSATTQPRIGDTVSISGRVTLGGAVLDTLRLRLYIEDTAGGAHIYGGHSQRKLPLRVGDSVSVRGVIARYRNAMELAGAVVTVLPVAPRPPRPLQISRLRDATHDTLQMRLATVEATVARTQLERGLRMIELSDPSDSLDRRFYVVEPPAGDAPLDLSRFSPGDRLRITGVLGLWQNPATGQLRYNIYPRGAADMRAVELTRHQTRRLIWVIGTLAVAMALLVWFVSHRRARRIRERQREASDRALRESEERFRLVSRATKDVIWEWNVVTGRLSWNEAVHSVLGRTTAELGDTMSDRASHLHPEDRERVLVGLEQAVSNGAQNDWSDQYRYRKIDGDYATVFDRAYIVRDAEGRALRMIGAMQDMTPRLELEAQLRHAQKMEAVGQLAAGVAHDFNNILTAINGFSDLVLAELGPDSPVRADVEQIQLAGTRAAALTRQLLAFSRRQSELPQVVDLNAVIAESERLLRRTVGEQIALDISRDSRPCTVVADRGQLTQVLLNFAINARDAMAATGGVLSIESSYVAQDALPPRARTPRTGPHVMLVVRDTGTGIDEAIQDRIFEPFFTTKAPGVGTGLGLSTVYGIVSRYGGTVFVDSRPSHGTAFTVLLPHVEAPEAPPLEHSTPLESREPCDGSVLLVEDEASVRVAVKRTLQKDGFVVREAKNAVDALELWRRHREEFAAIVSDVVMPDMDGPALVELLRRDRSDIPVVFVSGYTDHPLNSPKFAQPFTSFLAKPFELDMLTRTLRRLMTTRRAAEPVSIWGGGVPAASSSV